jgi:predicted phage-related endonuclease
VNAIPVILDSPEWHALREKHVGGSEIAALFDLPADQRPGYLLSRFALWHIKAGNAPPPAVDKKRTSWGLKLERVIAEAAAEESGWGVTKGGYVSDPTTTGLGCTLDYVIQADRDEEGPGVLECKNVDWLIHRRSWDDEPPLHILLQHQHQLAATGYTWGAVAVLVGGNDLKVYRYKARPKIIADIRRRVREFWESIEAGREPPVDGSDSASAVLASLYGSADPEPLDLSADNEMPEICASYLNAAQRRKAAEAQEVEFKNRLIAKLQGHLQAETTGFRVKVSVTPEKPPRPAEPGEIIAGRKESRRYMVKEIAA